MKTPPLTERRSPDNNNYKRALVFFWFSKTGEKEAWTIAPAEQRASIISTVKPQFVTVLDVADPPQPNWERAEYLRMKYLGPLYFDFDLDATDEEGLLKTTQAFKLFLLRLQEEFGVNLHCLKLFATGGRGYHIEVPMQVFAPKAAKTGVTMLPLIYREIALDLAVDTLDLRIYSTRKGRMWRVPNLERANGRYKVPITVDEALHMEPEKYLELTKAPRYYHGDPAKTKESPWLYSLQGTLPSPLEPEVALTLQSLYLDKSAQVNGQIAKQAKVKDERSSLAKYRGKIPASIESLMNGEHLREDLGFNTVALQLAIVGAAFGLSTEEFMEKCDGFVKTHSGDGSRYNSPRKRAEALRDRYMYVSDSPVYVFSQAGLKSICALDYTPADIFGNSEASFAPVIDLENPDEDVTEGMSEEEKEAYEAAMRLDPNGGVTVKPNGIYVQMQDQLKMLTDMTFANPWVLRDAVTKKVVGFSAVVRSRDPFGRMLGREFVNLPASVFSSRANLDAFCSGYMSAFSGTDIQATAIRNILSKSAQKEGNMQYVLTREGVDIIDNPAAEGEQLVVWSSADKVLTKADFMDTEKKGDIPHFVYRPRLTTNSNMGLDVHLQSVPPQTPEFAEWFRTLLQVNRPAVIGNMLGWFVSCFHRQFHHRAHNEFPLLYVYGAAGSGKSTTPKLLMNMFTTRGDIGWETLSRGTTNFAIQSIMSRSTTAPAIIDEFKRDMFTEVDYARVLGEFRLAYNAALMQRGGVSDGSAKSDYREVHLFARTTPIVVLSESMVDDPATRERIVPVGMRREDQNEYAWGTVYAEKNRIFMSQVGNLLLRRTLAMTPAEFDAWYRRVHDEIRPMVGHLDDRPHANTAVVVMGLEFLAESLKAGVGLDVDKEIRALRNEVVKDVCHEVAVTPITPQATRVMQDLAYISRQADVDPRMQIREMYEYIVDDGFIDIDMRATFMRYQSYAKANGMPMPLHTWDAFCAGLAKFEGLVDTQCLDSKLRKWAATIIFRFDTNVLGEKGVEPFKISALND